MMARSLAWLTCMFVATLCVDAIAAGAAPPCKYKRDGAGNCLSPAFYKCQKDWKKCTDRCKTSKLAEKCNERCELKYAPSCGD